MKDVYLDEFLEEIEFVHQDESGQYPEPVTTWDEVLANVKEFNQNLNPDSFAYARFAQFSHWYYVSDLKLFGPSKFIGYKDMTHECYRGDGSGGITQLALRRFFEPVEHGSAQYIELLGELTEFARAHARKISAKTIKGRHGGIYIPMVSE